VAHERVQLAVLGHRARERALTPAVANDQGPHGRKCRPPPPRGSRRFAAGPHRMCTLVTEGRRMRHRTVIAVSFLDGAAVAAALFFGLQPHSTPTSTAHHVAVARAAPPSAPAMQTLLEEEARAREALQAADKASRAQEKHAREAKRAKAKISRAQKLRAREARRAAAQSGAAEKQTSAAKPKATPHTKKQKPARSSKPKHRESSHAQAESKRQIEHERAAERREREHAQREAAREKRQEERHARHAVAP
jgi:hypothetical protein